MKPVLEKLNDPSIVSCVLKHTDPLHAYLTILNIRFLWPDVDDCLRRIVTDHGLPAGAGFGEMFQIMLKCAPDGASSEMLKLASKRFADKAWMKANCHDLSVSGESARAKAESIIRILTPNLARAIEEQHRQLATWLGPEELEQFEKGLLLCAALFIQALKDE